jgi:type II restriction enzyme
LKKIWEITGPSKAWPVKCQVKQDIIYNIRPIIWYSLKPKFPSFSSRREFVLALNETLIQYNKTRDNSKSWLRDVEINYSLHTGDTL